MLEVNGPATPTKNPNGAALVCHPAQRMADCFLPKQVTVPLASDWLILGRDDLAAWQPESSGV